MNWMRGKGYGSHWRDCICEDSKIIAKVIGTGYPIGKGWSPESEETARLIVAAPAMLDALKSMVSVLDSANDFDAWEKAKIKMREAIELTIFCHHDWQNIPMRSSDCVVYKCSICGENKKEIDHDI